VLRILVPLCLALALVSQPAYAQAPPAASTTDRRHPFVTHAEGLYGQYVVSESKGDISAFKKLRTKQANQRVMENLRKLGKPESELGPMLKLAAKGETDLSQLAFVRCDAKAQVARLLYQREGRDPKAPAPEFVVFMFHWEDGAWRIGWIGRASAVPTRDKTDKRAVDELLKDPRFALD